MIITWIFILYYTICRLIGLDFGIGYIFAFASFSFWLMQKVATYIFKCEIALGIITPFTWGDKQGVPPHMQGVVILDGKLDCEDFKAKISKNIFKRKEYNKLKTRLHSNFFFHYFKEDKSFNIENHFEIIKKPMKNYEELYEMIAKNQAEITFSNDHPKWKFFLIESVGENESSMIMKLHHQYGDGMSFLSFLLDITDVNDYKIVKLPQFTKLQWVLALILTVFKVPWILIKTSLLTKTAKCSFHTLKGVTNKKRVYCYNNIDLNEMKKAGAKEGIKLNDMIVTGLIRSLILYSKKTFNEDLKNLIMIIPKSFRNIPDKGDYLPLGFEVMPFVINLPLFEWEGMKKTAKKYADFLATYKYSVENYTNAWCLEFLCMVMPEFIGRLMIQYVTRKSNCLFSNVPGPLNQVEFFGKKVNTMIPFVNIQDIIEVIFACFSYNGKLVLSCVADTSVELIPKDFINEFQRVLEEDFIGKKLN